MAEQKIVISSVEEAICTNCIYSSTIEGTPLPWCHHNEINERTTSRYFCNLGRWLMDDGDDKMVYAQTLSDVYYIFQGGAYK